MTIRHLNPRTINKVVPIVFYFYISLSLNTIFKLFDWNQNEPTKNLLIKLLLLPLIDTVSTQKPVCKPMKPNGGMF